MNQESRPVKSNPDEAHVYKLTLVFQGKEN